MRVGYDGTLTLTSYCHKKKTRPRVIIGTQVCQDGRGQVETRNNPLLYRE